MSSDANEPPFDAIRAGARVVIHGLAGRADLNGQAAAVASPPGAGERDGGGGERYAVAVASTGELVRVRRRNLRLQAHARKERAAPRFGRGMHVEIPPASPGGAPRRGVLLRRKEEGEDQTSSGSPGAGRRVWVVKLNESIVGNAAASEDEMRAVDEEDDDADVGGPSAPPPGFHGRDTVGQGDGFVGNTLGMRAFGCSMWLDTRATATELVPSIVDVGGHECVLLEERYRTGGAAELRRLVDAMSDEECRELLFLDKRRSMAATDGEALREEAVAALKRRREASTDDENYMLISDEESIMSYAALCRWYVAGTTSMTARDVKHFRVVHATTDRDSKPESVFYCPVCMCRHADATPKEELVCVWQSLVQVPLVVDPHTGVPMPMGNTDSLTLATRQQERFVCKPCLKRSLCGKAEIKARLGSSLFSTIARLQRAEGDADKSAKELVYSFTKLGVRYQAMEQIEARFWHRRHGGPYDKGRSNILPSIPHRADEGGLSDADLGNFIPPQLEAMMGTLSPAQRENFERRFRVLLHGAAAASDGSLTIDARQITELLKASGADTGAVDQGPSTRREWIDEVPRLVRAVESACADGERGRYDMVYLNETLGALSNRQRQFRDEVLRKLAGKGAPGRLLDAFIVCAERLGRDRGSAGLLERCTGLAYALARFTAVPQLAKALARETCIGGGKLVPFFRACAGVYCDSAGKHRVMVANAYHSISMIVAKAFVAYGGFDDILRFMQPTGLLRTMLDCMDEGFPDWDDQTGDPAANVASLLTPVSDVLHAAFGEAHRRAPGSGASEHREDALATIREISSAGLFGLAMKNLETRSRWRRVHVGTAFELTNTLNLMPSLLLGEGARLTRSKRRLQEIRKMLRALRARTDFAEASFTNGNPIRPRLVEVIDELLATIDDIRDGTYARVDGVGFLLVLYEEHGRFKDVSKLRRRADKAMEVRRCALCRKVDGAEEEEGGGTVKLTACSRCRLAYYCSKECQQRDWRSHKKYCTPV